MDTAKKTASTVAKAPAAKKPATSARTPSKNAPKAGRITQTKPTLAEGMANPNPGISDIGTGSVRETAPAVRIGADKRILQQGDDVILHVRSPIQGQTEVLARVIKVNQDATIAVRVPNNGFGRHEDFTGVKTAPQADGSFWASWPEGSQNLDEAAKSEEEAKPEPLAPIDPPKPVDPATAAE